MRVDELVSGTSWCERNERVSVCAYVNACGVCMCVVYARMVYFVGQLFVCVVYRVTQKKGSEIFH